MPLTRSSSAREPQRDPEVDAALLRAVYLLLLHREPDDGGLARNLEQLTSGHTWEAVLAELVRSPEFDALHRTTTDPAAVVRAAWRAVLWRDPPADALAWATQQLAEGMSIAELVDALSEIDSVPTIANEVAEHHTRRRETARELDALNNRLAALEAKLLDRTR